MTPGLTPGAGDTPAVDGLEGASPHFWVRVLDVISGLLSAGLLVVGVGLLLAALIAPTALAAAGLGVADGPGWNRVIAHLGVGVAGECVMHYRRGWPTLLRVLADLGVAVAALVVIWWAWLP